MGTDKYDNAFSSFSGVQLNIDGDAPEESIKLLEQKDDEDAKVPSELTETSPHAEILAVRPTERREISEMNQEDVATELTAYNMPTDSLSSLSPDIQARLLESFREKQDITEYQTIGAMQAHGQITSPKLLAISSKLSGFGLKTDLLTPEELAKINRFVDYRPEDTDEKLQIILDIITLSKNGARSRRDFANPDNGFYDRDKAEKLEDVTDKINDYLDNGGYEAYEEDPERVSEEERKWLVEQYGDDPAFWHCNRSELIDLGYLDEEDPNLVGPLNENDLSFINSIVAPSFASKVSNRSIDQVSDYYPEAAIFIQHSDRVSDLESAMIGKYVEQEVANKRTLEPKALVCGFLALEKEFFESGFTRKMEQYLKENPNDNIESTYVMLRRKLQHGGRYCNLLTNGSDTKTREKYGSMITTSPDFLSEVLEKATSWDDSEAARRLDTQSGYVVKLDGIFEEVRIAYSGLKAVLESQTGGSDESGESGETRTKGISAQSIHRAIEASSRANYDSQFTGEADITMPNDSDNQ